MNKQDTKSSLSLNEIALHFAREYYTMLSCEPARLHCFYNKNSHLLHTDCSQTDPPTCLGLSEIHERIQEMGFEGAHVAIDNIDCQQSLNGSILLFVTGKLTWLTAPPKHKKGNCTEKTFSQTILLAEQPNGYYVINDIMRMATVAGGEDDSASLDANNGGGSSGIEARSTPQFTNSLSVGTIEIDLSVDAASSGASSQNGPSSAMPPLQSTTTPTIDEDASIVAPTPTRKAIPQNNRNKVNAKQPPTKEQPTTSSEGGSKAKSSKHANKKTEYSTVKKKIVMETAAAAGGVGKEAENANDHAEKLYVKDDCSFVAGEESNSAKKEVESKAATPTVNATKPSSWAGLAAEESNLWKSGIITASKGTVSSVQTKTTTVPVNVKLSAGVKGNNANASGGSNKSSPIHAHRTNNNKIPSQQQYNNKAPREHRPFDSTKAIFVASITTPIDRQTLLKRFQQFGAVASMDVVFTKRIAFVEFEDASAQASILAHSAVLYNDQPMKISVRRVMAPPKQHGGNRGNDNDTSSPPTFKQDNNVQDDDGREFQTVGGENAAKGNGGAGNAKMAGTHSLPIRIKSRKQPIQ